jgi:Zn-dependent protease
MRKHLGSLIAAVVKVGGVGLKLLKSVKVLKVGLAGASLAAYSWMFTPQFAVILITALVVHEYGHLRAMHACGIPTKGIFLIPFFGGAAVAEEGFSSRRDESYCAMMGPAWGLGTALLPALICFIYPHPALAGTAAFIALMNLFNMLPINPLDGGRVIKSIAFSIDSRLGVAVLMAGMLAVFAGMLFLNIGLFLLIGFIAALELLSEWYSLQRKDLLNTKPRMSSSQILWHFAGYTGLTISFLAVIRWSAETKGAEIALKALAEGN